jgi:hypothetical protein
MLASISIEKSLRQWILDNGYGGMHIVALFEKALDLLGLGLFLLPR